MKDNLKLPASKESTAGKETIDAAPNQGNVIEAQPTVDAGCESGCGHWVGNSDQIRFVKE